MTGASLFVLGMITGGLLATFAAIVFGAMRADPRED